MISMTPEQNNELARQAEMVKSLSYAATIMSGQKHTEDPAEQNIIPKRRPSPAYYLVDHPIIEIGDLTEDLPANIAAAMNYLYRCGRKPGADVMEDLLKAVDMLLREVDRQARLQRTLRRQQDAAP